MERTDDFRTRRAHLANMTEQQLEERFWELTQQLVSPMITLAERHTTPSIERSVLLRMGFSSLEAKGIVQHAIDHGLLGKGAGHIVYKLADSRNLEIRDAGLLLERGEAWDEMVRFFKGE